MKKSWLLLILLLLACMPERESELKSSDAKIGKEIYQKNCMRCHGENAYGSSIAPFAITKRASFDSAESFHKIVKDGVDGTFMRGFDLTKLEIESIRLYLKGLGKK